MNVRSIMNQCKAIKVRAVDLIYDPNPLLSCEYKKADNWQADVADSVANTERDAEASKFIYERIQQDFSTLEDAQESLYKKCNELLKLDTALIIGIVGLLRYADDAERPYLVFCSVVLVIPVLVMLRCLSGLPWSKPTDAKELLKWHIAGDKTEAMQIHSARISYRALVFNRYVNGWVATRLTLAWVLTVTVLLFASLYQYFALL